MALRPLGDRVIAKPVDADTKTAGGLVLPDSAKERPQRAEIIAVGPGKMDDNGTVNPLDVKVGDVVLYSRYGGTEVKVGAAELIVLSEHDILAVINEEK